MPQAFGALSQLNATGGIEKYLIDSPSLTFWRFQHLKYTNFAVDNVETPLQMTGTNKGFVDIERQGDLISNMYLQLDTAGLIGEGEEPHYIDSIGQMIIKQCVMQIGGQCVQDISGAYMYAWEELSGKEGKLLQEMTGKYGDAGNLKAHSRTSRRHYVPIPFWFTQTSGSALPLISLQFHRLKVMFTFETDVAKLVNPGNNTQDGSWGIRKGHEPGKANWSKDHDHDELDKEKNGGSKGFKDLFNMSLLISYVYLSQEERQRFADGSFEYLITQVQEQVMNGGSETLNFNHSVMELIWAIENPKGDDNDKAEPFGGCQMDNMEYDTVENVSLKFNNHDRVDPHQPGVYYRLVQPYQHHSRIPKQKIYCYNFGLHPEEAQPSGAVNMSRIDKITFQAHKAKGVSEDAIFHVWARNFNVLKIENGLGGQMYAS